MLKVHSSDRSSLTAAARHLFALAQELDWKSYDPFDLLSSPLVPRGRYSWFLSRLVVQLGLRLGARPRHLLRVQQHVESGALSDFLSAAALLLETNETWAANYISPLADQLASVAVETRHGLGWAMEFPYASRYVNVEARAPNIMSTLKACRALLDVYPIVGDQAGSLALDGVRFITQDLGWFEANNLRWFRYWPDSTALIVNVQALCAGLLARVGVFTGDGAYFVLADGAARTVIQTQRSDGSWRYSEDGRANFVDGLHTGFTLDGLSQYSHFRGTGRAPSVALSMREGLSFYRGALLSVDGRPLSSPEGKLTKDTHTMAQSIQTLAVCGGSHDLGLALRGWSELDNDLRSWNSRMDRRGGWIGQGYPSVRWSLGPAVLALANLIRALEG